MIPIIFQFNWVFFKSLTRLKKIEPTGSKIKKINKENFLKNSGAIGFGSTFYGIIIIWPRIKVRVLKIYLYLL